jgi:ABC-2 type transport system ATP-binding protein
MLDEPLTGLDAAIARQMRIFWPAGLRHGAAIILTIHILEVAERLADRIGICNRALLRQRHDIDPISLALGLLWLNRQRSVAAVPIVSRLTNP